MLIKLFAAFWLVVGVQACCTTPDSTPSGATPTATATTEGAPARAAASDDIPAVVGVPPNPGPAAAYRIGPNDLLKIEVFQVEDLTTEGRVDGEGSFVIPLIGKVRVSGLTPSEAQQVIANRLGKSYLNNPQVSVFVSESARQRITVRSRV